MDLAYAFDGIGRYRFCYHILVESIYVTNGLVARASANQGYLYSILVVLLLTFFTVVIKGMVWFTIQFFRNTQCGTIVFMIV